MPFSQPPYSGQKKKGNNRKPIVKKAMKEFMKLQKLPTESSFSENEEKNSESENMSFAPSNFIPDSPQKSQFSRQKFNVNNR